LLKAISAESSENKIPSLVNTSLFLSLFFLILLGSLLIICTFASALEGIKPKNVLFLFQGGPGQPLYSITLSEVTSAIQKGLNSPLNLFAVYLDAERFPDKHDVQAGFDFIKKKYARKKMDLFIPVGPNILPLISQYLSPEFDKVPTVFIEFQDRYADGPPINLKPNMTGLIGEPNPQKTLELILSLHSGIREVFIITGSAPVDRFLESIVRVAYREYENRVKVTYLSGLSMRELLQRVSSLPKNSVGVYFSFTQDAKGMSYYAMDSSKLLSEASSVPLYSNWEMLLGHGIVGGYVLRTKPNGSKVAQMALRILKGEDPSTIPVERGSMFYMFDWRQMKRWGIQERNLPAESLIINKELTFWEAFRWYIIGTAMFVIIETLLVVFLIALYRKQKNVQKRLHEAAEEWRTTFDSIQNPLFILDLDFKVIRVNAPALAFLNLPAEKVVGRHCYSLLHGTKEPPEICLVPTMKKTKRHERTEYYDQKRKAWFRISVGPIVDERGEITGIVHQLRDITEQKEAEAEIHGAHAQLLRLERLFQINELTASLAHELNQPLAAILSNAQAALRFLETDPPDLKELREILRDIVHDDKRAGNVIRSLRSMMRRAEEEKKPVMLNEVIEDVVAILHSEAVFRNVRIETELSGSVPPVLADRIQLQQVILNLIMNATEASPENRPEERRIIVRTEKKDSCVRASVRDFGRGFEKENLNRLFQPFFTTKGAGLGMGLTLSRSVIEANGGRIWAENHPDGGAVVTFELPIINGQ